MTKPTCSSILDPAHTGTDIYVHFQKANVIQMVLLYAYDNLAVSV